jgi:hypothetical protein
MSDRLMSEQDLQHVTGKKRHSAQAAWFQLHFGVTPVQSGDGRIILTWATFEGMQAKRAGIAPGSAPAAPRPTLQPLRRIA